MGAGREAPERRPPRRRSGSGRVSTPPEPMRRRPTKAELATFQGARVDDLLVTPLRLLFVGINPGLWTAAVNAHFARPGNRFWPALHQAGITTRQIDASTGFTEDDRAEMSRAGVGITNLVPVATARADELSAVQLREGGARLQALVREAAPTVVAVLGITAFRQAFGRRDVVLGRQDDAFEGAELWVLGNPSGLNAHETVASLARWYRAAAEAAGVPLSASP
jgi:TDG/mug DNA glycosylase family protein